MNQTLAHATNIQVTNLPSHGARGRGRQAIVGLKFSTYDELLGLGDEFGVAWSKENNLLMPAFAGEKPVAHLVQH